MFLLRLYSLLSNIYNFLLYHFFACWILGILAKRVQFAKIFLAKLDRILEFINKSLIRDYNRDAKVDLFVQSSDNMEVLITCWNIDN